MGVGVAAQLMQRALRVSVDGIVGTKTLAAAKEGRSHPDGTGIPVLAFAPLLGAVWQPDLYARLVAPGVGAASLHCGDAAT